MRKAVGCLFLLLVGCLFSGAVVLYGFYEMKTAKAIELSLALDFNSATDEYQDLERHLGYGSGVASVLLSGFNKEVRLKRIEAGYWQKNYGELLTMDTDNHDPEKEDSAINFMRGNSSYRTIETEKDKKKVLKGLEDAILQYIQTIRKDPENADASFNYEYLLQVRSSIASSKKALPLKGQPKAGKGELPADEGTNIHGHEGRPAKDKGETTIKIHIPLEGDEAKDIDGKNAGKGDAKRRKG